MSWLWIVVAVWVWSAVCVAAGWVLHGSVVDEPTPPFEPEPMQWAWPTLATTASSTTITISGSDDAGAAGVREPRRPRPTPPHLQLVREYTHLTVVR